MKRINEFICLVLITSVLVSACDANSEAGLEYIKEETVTSVAGTDIYGDPVIVTETTRTSTVESVSDPKSSEITEAGTEETREGESSETQKPDREENNAASATPKPTVSPKPTITPRATNTPKPTATSTPRATVTPKPTSAPKATATPTPKPTTVPRATATPKPTATPSPRPTSTPKPTATSTPRPTATPVPTATPTPEPHDHDWVRTEHFWSEDGALGYYYFCDCGECYFEPSYSPEDPDRAPVAAIVRVPITVYGCDINVNVGTAWEDGDPVTVLVVRDYVVQPLEGAYYHDPCIDNYELYEIYEDPDDLYEGLYEVYPNAVAWGYGTACIDGNLVGPELIGFVDEPLAYYPWY